MSGLADRVRALEARIRARVVPYARAVADPPVGFGYLFIDQMTGKLALRKPDGTTTRYSASAGGGGAAAPRSGHVLADPFPTLATGIERHQGFLRLAEQTTFVGSSVNDLTSTSPGWTWRNSSALTSATRNAGTLTAVHGTTSTDGASAPMRYQSVKMGSEPLQWIARVAIDSDANYEWTGLQVVDTASFASSAIIAIGANGAGRYVGGGVNGTTYVGDVAITETQMTTGVWLMQRYVAGRWNAYYSVVDQATPPTAYTGVSTTGWVQFGSTRTWDVDSRAMAHGLYVRTLNTGGTTARWHYFSAGQPPGPWYHPAGGASGFDTTGAAQTLVASFDLGDDDATVSDADVQAALQQVENQLTGDAATITWSVTRASTASPAEATTYQVAASVNVKAGGSDTAATTGRYLAVRCKLTSDGTQRGSVNLMDLRVPYAVPA